VAEHRGGGASWSAAAGARGTAAASRDRVGVTSRRRCGGGVDVMRSRGGGCVYVLARLSRATGFHWFNVNIADL